MLLSFLATSSQKDTTALKRLLSLVADALALIALGVVISLFHAALAFSYTALTDYDLFTYFYPFWHYRAEALLAGRLPLWDPYTFTGAPFQANIQTGVFYLPNLFVLHLPTGQAGLEAPRAVALSYLGHLWLAAGGMYLLLRLGLNVGHAGSFTAGIVFALGGFLGAQAGHINQVQASSWLPFLSLGVLQTCRYLSIPWALLTAIFFSLLITAGHPQEAYLASVALGLLALYEAVRLGAVAAPGGSERLPAFLRPLYVLLHFLLRTALGGALFAAAVVLGGALAAIQLLPTLELSGFSWRAGGLPFPVATSFSLPPWEVLHALLPTYQDPPFREATGLPLVSEYNAYVGVAALSLSWLALAGWRREPHIPYFAGLAALGLFLAFGGYNPLYPFLLDAIPGINLFRVPARWLFLCAFGLAALAGLGMDWLWRMERQAPSFRAVGHALTGLMPPLFWGVLAFGLVAAFLTPPPALAIAVWLAGAIAVLGIGLLGPFLLRGPYLALPLLALLTLELWVARLPLPVSHPVPGQVYTALRPALTHLLQDQGIHRTLSIPNPGYAPGDLSEMRNILSETLPPREVEDYIIATKYKETLNPNLGLRFGLASLDGYDGGLLPLKSYSDLKDLVISSSGDARPPIGEGPSAAAELIRDRALSLPSTALLATLNVKYLVADRLYDAWVDGVYADLGTPQSVPPKQTIVIQDAFWDTATALLLYSYLEARTGLPPGAQIATLTLTDAGGAVYTWPLRVGIETASTTGALVAGAPGAGRVIGTRRGHPDQYIFLARFDLASPLVPRSIRIENMSNSDSFTIAGLVLTDQRTRASVSPPLDPRLRRVFTGDVKIYEIQGMRPRAYVATSARIIADEKAQLRTLPQLGPHEVILAEGQSAAPTSEGAPPAPDAAPPEAHILSYQPERVEVAVSLPSPGYLVLSDTFYPGWRVWVDGQEAEVLRANYLFRGVSVPAGAHTVQFRYLPASLQQGWQVTQVALLSISLLLIGDVLARLLLLVMRLVRWLRRPRTREINEAT